MIARLEKIAVRLSTEYDRWNFMVKNLLNLWETVLPFYGKSMSDSLQKLNYSVYRQLGDFSLGQGPVGGSASWGSASWGTLTCRISWAQFFFLIHSYLMNAKNEHYFLNKTYSTKTNYKVQPSFLLKFDNLIIIQKLIFD